MKYKGLLVFMVLVPLFGLAQSPVQWTFSAEKVGSNQYRVHLTARIQPGYHIFSMTQPEDAIVNPTKINFTGITDTDEIGPLKEDGMLEKVKDESLQIESWQFSGKVDFSGLITLKNKTKTTLGGQVEFQVCSSDKCYPPTKISFSLPLNH